MGEASLSDLIDRRSKIDFKMLVVQTHTTLWFQKAIKIISTEEQKLVMLWNMGHSWGNILNMQQNEWLNISYGHWSHEGQENFFGIYCTHNKTKQNMLVADLW